MQYVNNVLDFASCGILDRSLGARLCWTVTTSIHNSTTCVYLCSSGLVLYAKQIAKPLWKICDYAILLI